jgi:transposase, IS30 family
MRARQHSIHEIACELNRAPSTIYREVARNHCVHDGFYRAMFAVQKASGRRRRSRRNGRYTAKHFAPIERLLRQRFSPEQIVGRLRAEGMEVMSVETIYLHIWRDKVRGGTLWRYLRGANKQRRKRYARKDSRGRLAGKRMITERPTVVAERSRLGDWEIDTVHGKGKPATVTIVERKSGLIRIGKLPRVGAQETLARATFLLRNELHPIHTITADNGTEFHMYKALEHQLGTTVYFATPHHAWERGTNENTNGLLRQYLPKGTCLKNLTQRQCTAIAQKLNDRPRRRLGFYTPNEVYRGISTLPRRWAASCGKLFGSCPRKQPSSYPESEVSTATPPDSSSVALQT